MFLKFPKLFVLMYLFVGLTACSSGGDESGGVPGDFYFQISVDGAPVQRINIDVSGPEYDIMAWYNTATDKTTVLALLEWMSCTIRYLSLASPAWVPAAKRLPWLSTGSMMVVIPTISTYHLHKAVRHSILPNTGNWLSPL